MAKIIYKDGCEGQNKLSCIEGIEIELLNGQKALIYPKYAERHILTLGQISKWGAYRETEIEALKVEDTNGKTGALLKLGSPAAAWVSQFWSDKYGIFCLPSLLTTMEIKFQKKEIDTLAETIEGANLLRDFTPGICSCSRCGKGGCWCASEYEGDAYAYDLTCFFLVVPTILYR